MPINSRRGSILRPLQQLRQLGDVGRDAPGFVAGEEVGVDPLELVANLNRIDKSLQGEICSVARSPLRVVCLNLRLQSKGWAATLDEDQKVGRAGRSAKKAARKNSRWPRPGLHG